MSSPSIIHANTDWLSSPMPVPEHFAFSPVDLRSSYKLSEVGAANSQVCAPHPPLQFSQPFTLLQVSDDAFLARSREMLLHSSGVSVTTLFSRQVEPCRLFSAVTSVLLCHTIKREQALVLAELLRNSLPGILTLRLTITPHLEEGLFDCVLGMPLQPQVLLHEAVKLCASSAYTLASSGLDQPEVWSAAV